MEIKTANVFFIHPFDNPVDVLLAVLAIDCIQMNLGGFLFDPKAFLDRFLRTFFFRGQQ